VDVLAIGVETAGTLHAPWMSEPIPTRGRAWLVHTWSDVAESDMLARRIEVFGAGDRGAFYAIHLLGPSGWSAGWSTVESPEELSSAASAPSARQWMEIARSTPNGAKYPVPAALEWRTSPKTEPSSPWGEIALLSEWLRFDPLEVIPQPFRWFIRRTSKPQEVWADAQIRGSLFLAPGSSSLPNTGEQQRARPKATVPREARSPRETEDLTAARSVTGVASITFLNPVESR
jgi:hypothetical protein